MQLHNIDFNLLLPLRVLLEERSVSRAAERMHMSQPALSASLARLRRHFNDELLERRGNAYTLTPLAAQLLERSYSALAGLERIFLAQAEFDPTTTTREFTVVSSDYGISVLGGPLATVLTQEAPRARLRFHPITTAAVNNAPDSLRDLDGLLMPHGFITDGSHEDLFADRWVCVVAADNTVVGDRLELEQLSTLPWVYTLSGPSEYTPAAKHMQLLGVEPRVDVVTGSFLVVPALLRGSDRIALVQESLATQMGAGGGVRILEAPFDVVPLVEAFWWNPVYDRDPEHQWFRSKLHEAVTRAGLRPPRET
ncbi:LysR family transcriptional regulator [Antribacter sp. KLBMP9083]|uniref:LysR family transcriptional regulator n=1 Tax=Antribacter soli TaxID=2910976 RepID=A0AA41QDD7_9MICO|nr:LysR family transcriptional regulator [Antribacter soli]MCF4121087.1 LysR family transcriptional regulator [Antribacter soli]